MFPSPDKEGRGDALVFDHRLVKALDNPVRAGFLRLLAERGTLAAREAIDLLEPAGLILSNVVYHVRVLNRYELIEPAGSADLERGQPFRATPKGESALAALGFTVGGEGV
jgi:hypothetical protein